MTRAAGLIVTMLLVAATACTGASSSNEFGSDEVVSEVVVAVNSSSPATTEPESLDDDSGSSSTMRPIDDESVVALSFDALMARRIACGFRPRDCDVRALAVVGSPLFDRLTALVDQRIRSGITASRRGSVRYRIEEVEVIDAKSAVVTSCLTDDTVLMSSGAIFDESQFSAVTRWSMQRHENSWLWFEDQVVDWRRGEDLCAFED